MFEGMPLPMSPLHVYALPLWICVFGVGATALLRVQFDREWALTMWTAYQIKRVWQRLADESARTGGTLTSHAIGSWPGPCSAHSGGSMPRPRPPSKRLDTELCGVLCSDWLH